jgi:hypothetical protein
MSTNPSPSPSAGSQELSWKKKLLYSCITLVIALLILEGLLTVVFLVSQKGKKADVHGQHLLSPYARAPWAQEYFAEERRTKTVYEPFIEWQRQEFQGKYVNISPEGRRHTWNPEGAGQNLKKLFCFGGSTMWGVGARDEFTIPSLLSRRLNRDGPRYAVTNFGEKGYSLTQEIILLLLQLKNGNIPDVVIFYDGVNEVLAAAMNGRAGTIYGQEGLTRRLSGAGQDKPGLGGKLLRELKRSKIYYGLQSLIAWVRPAGEKSAGVTITKQDVDLSHLADDIIADYAKNIKLLEALSRAYGFQYFLIWQPVLFTNQSLTQEERQLSAWQDKRLVTLYQIVYDRMRQKKFDHFYNFATLLDDKKKTFFISWCHFPEEGNDLIAQALFQLTQLHLE